MRVLVITTDRALVRTVEQVMPADEVIGQRDLNIARSLFLNAEQEEAPFDVVLCDVEINANGIELLKWSRKRPDPPVFVFVTTHERVVEAAWLGDGVLIKPIADDQVRNTLARLLRGRARSITRRIHEPAAN